MLTFNSTVYRTIAFGPRSGTGGRHCKYEMTHSNRHLAQGEANGFLSEERGGLVDLRVEVRDQDGRLHSASLVGTYRWDDTRKCAVLSTLGGIV